MGIISGYRPMRRRQLGSALLVLLLILSVVGVLLLIWINRRIINISHRLAERQDERVRDSRLDCIIVPGGPISQNGRPGRMLEYRLAASVQLYRDGRSGTILVSGDSLSPGYDEIAPMRTYLLAHGVPAENILTDPAGLDTFETLLRAKQLYAVSRAIIVTQPFHLQRALYIADRLQFDLAGAACDMPQDYQSWRFLPREIIARLKAFLDCEWLRIQDRQ
jgi:SanA protein